MHRMSDQKRRKGIVLAGGTGSRLHLLTRVVSKQLLPVYNKPMIFYPLSTLQQAGITETLITANPHDQASFQKLLGDGSEWGLQLSQVLRSQPPMASARYLLLVKHSSMGPHRRSFLEIISFTPHPCLPLQEGGSTNHRSICFCLSRQ